MKPYTIAHISDLHLSAENDRSNAKNAMELFKYLRKHKVDHILLSGDITANARAKDYKLARSIFKRYGLLDARRMSVVIGNHDIFGGIQRAQEILDFPRHCKKTPYRKKIKEFIKQFHELFQDCQFAIKNQPFPYFKSLGQILLIGFNSVAPYAAVKNPVGSNGKVKAEHIKKVDEILSSGRFKHRWKIMMIHHHFNKIKKKSDGTMQSIWNVIENQTMKLRGKRDLFDLMRKHSIDLVVHGHYHVNKEYTRKGIKFINGGGTLLSANSAVLYVNIIETSPGALSISRKEIPAFTNPLT
jgi:3',5'-cyclic AMP phosphodiesterase CpdA